MENRITKILFDREIKQEEIGAFRGAILTLLPDDPVLHNHGEDKLLYRYPKVQYKICEGKACIIGLDEGAEILERELHIGDELTLKIGKRISLFTVSDKSTTYFDPERSLPEGFDYKITNWLPLNQENHIVYSQMKSLYERTGMLDSILTINILRLHQGLQHYIDFKCEAYITDILASRVVKYKNVDMLSFDIMIHTNLCLPEFFGIGKGSSRGHGTIMLTKQ